MIAVDVALDWFQGKSESKTMAFTFTYGGFPVNQSNECGCLNKLSAVALDGQLSMFLDT